MAAYITYLLTGILTLLPVLYMMLGAWMGVPNVVSEYFAAVGSCVLIVASYLVLFDRKAAAGLALAGSLLTLPFWIMEPVKAIIQVGFSLHIVILFALYLFCIVICVWRAIKEFRTGRAETPVSSLARLSILSVSAICLLVLSVTSYRQHRANQRTPCRYIIPDKYVGWIVIHFGDTSQESLPTANNQLIFNIPDSGLLRTSSQEQFGSAEDHYFYKMPGGALQELHDTGWGKGGMVWAESSGTQEVPGKPDDQTQQFFIGSEDQYNRMQNLPNTHDGLVPGDIRNQLR